MTISEHYLIEQQRLHENPAYGVASITFAPLVSTLLSAGACNSLSDYGAGKCNLKKTLGLADGGPVDYLPYDPAFPEYGRAEPADLLVCIDVLEHVEPECLDAVLDELSRLARKLVLLTVHTGPAKKLLSDGRNAHLIQQPASWWLDRLHGHFDLIHLQDVPKGFFVIGAPKDELERVGRELSLPRLVEQARLARPRGRRGLMAGLRKAMGLN